MIATRSITVTIDDEAGARTERVPGALALVDWARELVGVDRQNYAAHRDARIKLGAMLWQVKQQCPHGEFMEFVEAIGVKARTAQHAMKLAAKVASPAGVIDWKKVKALAAQAKETRQDLVNISFNRLAQIAGVYPPPKKSANAKGLSHLDPFGGLEDGEASGEWRVASGERQAEQGEVVSREVVRSERQGIHHGDTESTEKSSGAERQRGREAAALPHSRTAQLSFADLYAAADRLRACIADVLSRASSLGLDVVLERVERAEAALVG